MKKRYRFSLRLKMVLFTTILEIITYFFSGLLIYVIYDYIKQFLSMSERAFISLVLLGVVFRSGILAHVAGRLLTKPLERLEDIDSQAAKGHLKQESDKNC